MQIKQHINKYQVKLSRRDGSVIHIFLSYLPYFKKKIALGEHVDLTRSTTWHTLNRRIFRK